MMTMDLKIHTKLSLTPPLKSNFGYLFDLHHSIPLHGGWKKTHKLPNVFYEWPKTNLFPRLIED